jgi:hypothetical protein
VAGLVKQAGELVERGRRKRVGDQRGDRLVDGHLLASHQLRPRPLLGAERPPGSTRGLSAVRTRMRSCGRAARRGRRPAAAARPT